MHVEDFNRAWNEIEKSAVTQRWHKEMASLFAPLKGLQAGERFPMMQEVFYLE
jgi:L-rhamnose mutarotase